MLTKKLFHILNIIIIALCVYIISHKVLPNTWGISYNDSAYFWNLENKVDSIISSYSSDYNWVPLLQWVSLYTPKAIVATLLKWIGFNDFYSSYILTFGLVFIAGVVGYFIIWRVAKSYLFGLLWGVFIIFNNASIEYIVFWQFPLFLYFVALLWVVYIFYLIHLRKSIDLMDWIKIALLSSIILFPINLVAYCLLIIVLFIWVLSIIQDKRSAIFALIFTWFLTCLIQAYWIIPFFIGLLNPISWWVYWWNELAVLDWFSQIATHINMSSFRQYFNTISYLLNPSSLVSVFYIILLWIVSIWLLLSKRVRKNKFIIILLIPFFIFFNFSLGPNSPITWAWFIYLWEHYSFFHFFRSFTRFSIPGLILLIFILAIYFSYISQKKNSRIIVLLLFIFILILHYPLLSWNLNWIITSIKIPNEYTELNNVIKNNESVVAYPNALYETYDWAIWTSRLQREDYFIKEYIINSPVLYNRASLNLGSRAWLYSIIFDNKNINKNLAIVLRNNAIRYVIVQKSLISVFNWGYIDFKPYYDYFESKSEILLDNKEFTLFDLWVHRPKIYNYLHNFNTKRLSSTKYIVHTNLSNKSRLFFLENFHPDWKLYIEPYIPLDCGSGATTYTGTTESIGTWALTTSTGIYLSQRWDTIASIAQIHTGMTLESIRALNPLITLRTLQKGTSIVVTQLSESKTINTPYHVTECSSENHFYAGGELAKLWEKPIFDDTHEMVYDYANQWTIDPEYIKRNYPKNYYKENADGSIDIRLNLYFKPQSYFYLWLTISGLTLFGCISYLMQSSTYMRRKKVNSSKTNILH